MSLDFYVIDFETANNYANSACSVGVVRFIDGKESGSVYSLIHPAACGKIVTLAAKEHNSKSIPDLLKKCLSKLSRL